MTAASAPVDTTAAEAYEKFMVSGMFRAWTERLVDLAEPRPGERILDVACGTGIGARVAAQRVGGTHGRIAGLDIDPGVLEVARRISASAALPIEWHRASALGMPFGSGEFDLCLCFQGVQFFPDRIAGLAEIRRVLEPRGGRFVASVWGPLESNEGHRAVVEALERRNADASPAKRACSFADADDIRDAATRAGFVKIGVRSADGVSHFESIKAFLDGMMIGSPSTRHAVALLSEDDRARFVEDVTAALERYVVHGELQYPMRTHILTASAS